MSCTSNPTVHIPKTTFCWILLTFPLCWSSHRFGKSFLLAICLINLLPSRYMCLNLALLSLTPIYKSIFLLSQKVHIYLKKNSKAQCFGTIPNLEVKKDDINKCPLVLIHQSLTLERVLIRFCKGIQSWRMKVILVPYELPEANFFEFQQYFRKFP